MGKLAKFLIEYDENQHGVFMAGQTVTGRVCISLKEPMKVRGVHLTFIGRTLVSWKETHTQGNHTRTEHYTDSEFYFHNGTTVYGRPKNVNGEDVIMQAGDYQLPFAFLTPAYCPSSYEGQYGSIRYMVTAVIDKPWKFDHTTVRPMTIVAWVDLNNIQNVELPYVGEKMKTVGTWCFQSGNITCQMKLPRTGYVPGERIPLYMTVSNDSGTTVDEVKVSVEESVAFYARGKCRASNRTFLALKKGNILPGQTQVWENEPLRVPAIAPTLSTCRILTINYYLQIVVHVGGVHRDLSATCPLIIGNIPLRPPPMQQSAFPAIQQPNIAPSAPAEHHEYNLGPPTYESAVYGASDVREEGQNEHTMGETSFAPKYPVYNVPNS